MESFSAEKSRHPRGASRSRRINGRTILASSTLVAGAIAVALILRSNHSIPPGPEMAVPEGIPPSARAAIRAKMRLHAQRLPTLISSAVALDYEGVARSAGEIFDEPALARPAPGDELDGLLPERFFVLQGALRAAARSAVEGAARRDSVSLSRASGELIETCVSCHDLYLHSGH